MVSTKRAADGLFICLLTALPLTLLCLASRPSDLLFSHPYGYRHCVLDWTCLALFCMSVLFYSARWCLEADKAVARHFGWAGEDECPGWLKLVVVVQVVAITYANFLTGMTYVFGEQIAMQASAQTKLAIYYAKVVCNSIVLLSLVPAVLHLWLHFTGQGKSVGHAKPVPV